MTLTPEEEDELLDTPTLQKFKMLGIEMDQRLYHAWAKASEYATWFHASPPCITDDMIVAELLKLNPKIARYFDVSTFLSRYPLKDQFTCGPCSPDETIACGAHFDFWGPYVSSRAIDNTIKSSSFIAWLVGECLNPDPIICPSLAEAYAELFNGTPDILRNTPVGRKFVNSLHALANQDDDFQYLIAFNEGRIVFRVASVLDDYQLAENGKPIFSRTLLTHCGKLGLFTEQQIEELEYLINANAKEAAFQEFFEANRHFLRQWDYRAVHPQVYLTREGDDPLVPDFILTNNDIQRATIVDLKRPCPKLIRKQRNRDRFAAAVMEARAQLLTYRRYFDDGANRRKMQQKLGMEIYCPHLAVVIGRSSEFASPLQRQQLRADFPDVEVVTYDDILSYAKKRRVLLEL